MRLIKIKMGLLISIRLKIFWNQLVVLYLDKFPNRLLNNGYLHSIKIMMEKFPDKSFINSQRNISDYYHQLYISNIKTRIFTLIDKYIIYIKWIRKKKLRSCKLLIRLIKIKMGLLI